MVDDGHGDDDLLHLIVEIKGPGARTRRKRSPRWKPNWVPSVNQVAQYGRWAFAEFKEVYQIEADFKAKVEREFNKMITNIAQGE